MLVVSYLDKYFVREGGRSVLPIEFSLDSTLKVYELVFCKLYTSSSSESLKYCVQNIKTPNAFESSLALHLMLFSNSDSQITFYCVILY